MQLISTPIHFKDEIDVGDGELAEIGMVVWGMDDDFVDWCERKAVGKDANQPIAAIL